MKFYDAPGSKGVRRSVRRAVIIKAIHIYLYVISIFCIPWENGSAESEAVPFYYNRWIQVHK